MANEPSTIGDDIQRALARDYFNGTWALLEQADRSPDDDARMVHMAHASVLHWGNVGTATNAVRGEWQCSRVYAVLGRAEPALYHARRALAICRREGIGGFDLAYCYEALARASAVAGDAGEAEVWLERAHAAAQDVADAEDRDLLLADLETVPSS